MSFTLINARPSPYGRKVAIALIEKGLPYSVRYDVPWGPDTCAGQHNPLAQIPILISPSGETVYDSTYILEWLEGRYPAPALLPVEVEARLAAKKRQMLGERLIEFAQSLIFETHRPEPSAAWIDRQSAKVLGGFAELERQYTGRPLPAEGGFDLGDIATGTTLGILEFVVPAGLSPDLDAIRWRGRYPALTRYMEALEARPSFVATVPKPMDVDLQATVA